ncbi:MAG TPA: hypothetical protein VK907_02790, partial [Phnomibacter sp.]|nr:hypothetical protein [Phnomibacter sp.]
MQNRFNRLGSKEWLPFQKSWFRYQDLPTLYRSNLRFFCKADAGGSQVVYMGPHRNIFEQVAVEENIPLCRDMGNDEPVQFIFIDLLDEITPSTSLPQYEALWQKSIHQLHDLYPLLEHRRF